MQQRIHNLVSNKNFDIVMLVCIAAYASLKFPFRSVADIFQTVFLLGFLYCLAARGKILVQNPIFKLFVMALFVPILSWTNAMVNLPELAESRPSLGNITNLFYFIPIALLLNNNRKSILFVWAAFAFGLLLSAFYYTPNLVNMIERAVNGERVDYGFYNLQHASAWAGACIIIIVGVIAKTISDKRYTRMLIAMLTIIPFAFILITTQTRQTIFGLVAAFILTSAIYLLKHRVKKRYLSYGAITLLVVLTLSFNNSGLKSRFLSDSNTMVTIISGEYTNFVGATDSAGIRYSLWYAGLQWAKSHPILGGDREISEHIINTSPYTPAYSLAENHRHLHSYYMEILVSYGLLGLATITLLFALIYSSIYKSHSNQEFDEIRFVGLTFIPYWLIVNFFEPHLLTSPGQLIHNVMIGTVFIFTTTQPMNHLKVKG